MRKFAMLAVVTVMLMGLLAGCRGSGNETSAPTTAAPTTMAPTTTQAPTTTMATLPDTTSNIITEASEAIDDMLPGNQGGEARRGPLRPMG
jgi:hypothetical protein